MATSLWLRTIRHHRIDLQATQACGKDEAEQVLSDLCQKLDLPRPLWLAKNRREWAEFGQTRFLPDAFFEKVSFERMEIEYVDTEAAKKRSQDPRNG